MAKSLAQVHITEKKNNEKRGMFVGTGVDGTNEVFVNLHCVISNS